MGLCEIKKCSALSISPQTNNHQICFSRKIGSCIYFWISSNSGGENPTAELETTDIRFLWTNFEGLDLRPPDVSRSAVVVASPTKPNHTQHNIPQSDEVFGALNDLCKNLEDACPGRTCRFRDKNDGRHLLGREKRSRERCTLLHKEQSIDSNSMKKNQYP